MSSITIRNLEPSLEERLRVRAAEHGQSIEAEVLRILRLALNDSDLPSDVDFYDRVHSRFATLESGADIELPPREPAREPPRFD